MYPQFFQLCFESFLPYNESPSYLKGAVEATEDDGVHISGVAEYQNHQWYNIGCSTSELVAHDFAFSVDAIAQESIGAYSIGIQGDASINIGHFLSSALALYDGPVGENIFSGWGHDNRKERTQTGGKAPWDAVGRHHNLMVQYDDQNAQLFASINGIRVHEVHGKLEKFVLTIRFQAVGVSGDFSVKLRNICYYSFDNKHQENVQVLHAWDPQYAPVFVSYSHKDRNKVRHIIGLLRAARVRVLGDWDFKVGDTFQDRITQGICRAGYLLVFLSQNSVSSSWVKTELQTGFDSELQDSRLHVIPLLIEDCQIPPFLKTKLYCDLRGDETEGLNRLLKTIRSYGDWRQKKGQKKGTTN